MFEHKITIELMRMVRLWDAQKNENSGKCIRLSNSYGTVIIIGSTSRIELWARECSIWHNEEYSIEELIGGAET